jgi:hypothetical protein
MVDWRYQFLLSDAAGMCNASRQFRIPFLFKVALQLRQKAGVNNTSIVKISSRPISMAKLSMTLAVELRPA